MKPFPIYVGFDPDAEPIAYHAFCQSVIEHSSIPVAFIPLALKNLAGYKETHTDGSNQFIYSRFLVPHLNGYKGHALFADGDMICRGDVAELLEYANEFQAVQVVKHDYTTSHPIKYLGAKNDDYPRKNWSSVILWNCGHWQNRKLTPEYVMSATGKQLHRFEHLHDKLIGELPPEWNHLEQEQDHKEANLVHYTIGTPCFNKDQHNDYNASPYAGEWWDVYKRLIHPLTGNGIESKL